MSRPACCLTVSVPSEMPRQNRSGNEALKRPTKAEFHAAAEYGRLTPHHFAHGLYELDEPCGLYHTICGGRL